MYEPIELHEIQVAFNRAALWTFNTKKLLTTSFVLALCGLLAVFFRALAIEANPWLLLSLSFLPIFLCAGVLLSAGIFLMRLYHDEVKRKTISYIEILNRSWEIMIGASYFSIPIILCYLLLWMLLGVFVLLGDIEGLGEYIGVLLSFAPFLINFISLLLTIFNISMLFFVAPILALNGLGRSQIFYALIHRIQADPFSNLLLYLMATFPLLCCLGLLSFSAMLTGTICMNCSDQLYVVLQWFFMMIPFTMLLAPAVVFFFNFAAEAHVLLQKKVKT